MAAIKANYSSIPGLISALERSDLRLCEAIRHVDHAQGLLKHIDGDVGEFVEEKLDGVLEKNEGLHVLRIISQILSGETTATPNGYNYTADELAAFKYAPIVSCVVERSFSKYKSFFRDNRQSFSFANIRKHMIVACNPWTRIE